MTSSISFGAVLGAAVLTLSLAAARSGPRSEASGVEQRPAVVAELFTSEGCSSCPPADRLLADIRQVLTGSSVDVIALEEHVDYWDRLGWRDPFSSPVFTNRQSEYASRVFRTREIYTPQLVVDGAFEAVGSNRAAVRAAIASAAGRPGASVRVHVDRDGNRARVQASVTMPESIERHGAADVVIAVAEDGLVSHVSAGENRGRTLEHAAVVRSLTTAGVLPPGAASTTVASEVPVAAGWRTDSLRVVVFLQERETRRILGVDSATLGRTSMP